jgi:hypothetical protein
MDRLLLLGNWQAKQLAVERDFPQLRRLEQCSFHL